MSDTYNLLTSEGRQALRAALDHTAASQPKAYTFPADWDLSDPRLRSLALTALEEGTRAEEARHRDSAQLVRDHAEWKSLCRTGAQVSPTLVLYWDSAEQLRAAKWRRKPKSSFHIRGVRWVSTSRPRIHYRTPRREEIPDGLAYRVPGGRVTHVWGANPKQEWPHQVHRPRPNDPLALLSQGRTPYPLEHFRIPSPPPEDEDSP